MDILYGVLCFLAPVGMLLMGILWKITPPPFQKSGLSYNTELTRNNPEAWETAHRHCSKLWIRIGIISGCVSGILLKLFFSLSGILLAVAYRRTDGTVLRLGLYG